MIDRDQKANENRFTERTFRSLLEHCNDGIVLLSADIKPIYASPSVKNMLGYTEEEVMNMDLFSIIHPDDIPHIESVLEQVFANPGVPVPGYTSRMKHKNGTWRTLESTVTNLLHDPDVGGIVDNFRDVTEKKAAEAKITHANRLYAFISQINQTIVHSTNEQDLFRKACEIAIKFGDFKTASIGIFDKPSRTISMVEVAGMLEEDIPLFANIRYEEDGPMDQVLKSRSHFIYNDIQNDSVLPQWKAFAELRGYGSFIALPIRKVDEIIGTFNIYSEETNYFDKQEVDLLTEAAGDISFALNIFEKEKLRVQAEDALAKSESNLHAILENTEAAIYSLDRELCYVTFNNNIKKNIKNIYDIDIRPGDSVYAILDKLEPGAALYWRSIYDKALAGEVVKFESDFMLDNTPGHMACSVYPMWENSEIIGLACFVTDITAQKQDLLQKEKMMKDIIHRNKNLEQFSYIVSHNLRGPVANILGLTEILTVNEQNQEDKEIIENIFTSVKNLDMVINDLNYILQAENHISENIEVVRLDALLSEIRISAYNLLSAHDVEIIGDFSAINEVRSLKSYLHSIFFNLISNSIKYRRPDTKPVINIASAMEENAIRITFKDNGLGIDLERNADHVFSLYKRFHPQIEGKGMGLYMVKKQVEALRGFITIDSVVNEGTTFTIVFEAI